MNSLRFITLFLSIIICSSLVSHSGGLVSAKITDGWIKRDQELIFGLQINLEKDWKTYWRLPGKTGLRPTFNFNSSENILAAEIMWPTPIIFGEADLWSIGYTDNVLLPIKVTPIDISKPVKLTVEADIGICNDVCILQTLDISYSATPSQNKKNQKIMAAILSSPIDSNELSFKLPQCIINNGELTVKLDKKDLDSGLRNISLFVIEVGNSVFFVNSKRSRILDDHIFVSTAKGIDSELPTVISRDKIRTTIIGPNQSLEFFGCSS